MLLVSCCAFDYSVVKFINSGCDMNKKLQIKFYFNQILFIKSKTRASKLVTSTTSLRNTKSTGISFYFSIA